MSREIAVIIVVLGAGQLLFLRWADAHLTRSSKLAIILPAFFAYLLLVIWLLRRLRRRSRTAAPRCPHCGVAMGAVPERVALRTGLCDVCGGRVIQQ